MHQLNGTPVGHQLGEAGLGDAWTSNGIFPKEAEL
jgi:hypothetical protein